jgi:hypothetical protein
MAPCHPSVISLPFTLFALVRGVDSDTHGPSVNRPPNRADRVRASPADTETSDTDGTSVCDGPLPFRGMRRQAAARPATVGMSPGVVDLDAERDGPEGGSDMTTTPSTPTNGHAMPTRDQSNWPIELPPTCRYREACSPRSRRTTPAHRAAPPPTTHVCATSCGMSTCRHRRP